MRAVKKGQMSFTDAPVSFVEVGAAAIPLIQAQCPRVFLCVTRSKNGNIFCYEAVLNAHTGHLEGVQSFWLDLEPSYKAAARQRGRPHDRDEMSRFDTVAYGFTFKPLTAHTGSFRMDRAPEHEMFVRVSADGKLVQLFCEDPDATTSPKGFCRITRLHVDQPNLWSRATVHVSMESLARGGGHKEHQLSGSAPSASSLWSSMTG